MEAVGKTCLRHQELNQDWTDKFGIHEPTTVFGVMGKVNMRPSKNFRFLKVIAGRGFGQVDDMI